MKLSDIKGERVFDVIADVIGPVTSIASDKDAMRLFDGSDRPEGMEPWQFFVGRAKTAIPAIMRDHKREVCEIMSVLNGVTVDEYVNGLENPEYEPDRADEEGYDVPMYKVAPLTVPKLFADLLDLVNDSEFVSFFS